MTLDLFADPPPAAAPRAPSAQAYPMEPLPGDPNRWLYRSEVIVYDGRRRGRGCWSTVEGIGKARIASDDRGEVCRAIDARTTQEPA